MKYLALFLILALTVGVSVGQQLLATFGWDTHYLLIALVAIACAGLLVRRHLLLLCLVIGLSSAVNFPEETLLAYGLDRDVLMGVLVAMIVLPALRTFWRW